MDKELKEKYYGFVVSYISNKKICMTTMIMRKYEEKFFDDAVNDGILIEIDRNDEGMRQFVFTRYAEDILK